MKMEINTFIDGVQTSDDYISLKTEFAMVVVKNEDNLDIKQGDGISVTIEMNEGNTPTLSGETVDLYRSQKKYATAKLFKAKP